MKYVYAFIGVVLMIMGLSWVTTGNDFFLYKFFAPRQEQVRRQVFESTPSFNKGMVQELENMEIDYVKEKDKDAKAALRSVILHRAAGYNLNDPDVPADLRSFIYGLLRDEEPVR